MIIVVIINFIIRLWQPPTIPSLWNGGLDSMADSLRFHLITIQIMTMTRCVGDRKFNIRNDFFNQYFRVRLQRPATTSYLFVDVFPHNASEFTVIIITIPITITITIVNMVTIIFMTILLRWVSFRWILVTRSQWWLSTNSAKVDIRSRCKGTQQVRHILLPMLMFLMQNCCTEYVGVHCDTCCGNPFCTSERRFKICKLWI